jgi:LytS/YehU family sensor histidine kinase
MLAVYGNSLFFMPRYFTQKKIFIYLIYSFLFLLTVVVIRILLEYKLMLPFHKKFFFLDFSHFALGFLTVTTAFLFGGFLYAAKSYVGLLKKQEVMKTQQIAAELNLLKQQVQPHFLFNTLNNIYSLAHAKSDNTKFAIAKLADMMRYFTETAPKEKTPLQTEIEFIKNYIDLEQLRMVYPLKISMEITTSNVNIPTMLLMPFVENLFKHGVDKTINTNEAHIQIQISDEKLTYFVKNTMQATDKKISGSGLSNLKKRLELMYGDNHIFSAKCKDHFFEALMEIPL